MDEGKKFILAMLIGPPIAVGAFVFLFLDYYIPSARLEMAVQGVGAERARYGMEQILHGCRAQYRRRGDREYRASAIGTRDRSFPSIRNDKGWLAGTRVRCDDMGCTVTSSAMIPSPRESTSCTRWNPLSRGGPDDGTRSGAAGG